MNALTKALEDREWSVYRASVETGCSQQQIRNLMRLDDSRRTVPARVMAETMVRLLEALPELDIPDFVSGSPLTVRTRKQREAVLERRTMVQ